MADPGFPVGGRGPCRGAWTPKVATFCKICMSKRKNRVPWGAHPACAPWIRQWFSFIFRNCENSLQSRNDMFGLEFGDREFFAGPIETVISSGTWKVHCLNFLGTKSVYN